MATNYPGALDSLTNPGAGDGLDSPSHAGQHADANDAIEAVQTELGANPSGGDATVAARLTAIEAGTNLGTNSVGATQIADNAVDTAAIQSKAVTAAKIADDTITAAQIAANAVGASELADNAVDTNAIADSAVTSAKIADGTITATDVAASTFVAFGTVGNLLTANQASGTDTLGGTTGFGVQGGHALASSTSSPIHGTRSLTCTFAGTGAGGPTVGGSVSALGGATIPVTAGAAHTVVVTLKASEAATFNVYIYWYQSDGNTAASTASIGTSNTTSSATATEYRLTAVAPSNAALAQIYVRRVSGTDGAVWTYDQIGLWKGASGQWAMPGTPIVGQSHIATNNAVHLSGTGTPEGVVTAAPGSTWLQTDSTTDVKGWIRWVKATGTGNTGWVAGPEADTGWRDIAGDITWPSASGDVLGVAQVRRTGDGTCSLYVRGAIGSTTADTIAAVGALPAGFRPTIDSQGGFLFYTAMGGTSLAPMIAVHASNYSPWTISIQRVGGASAANWSGGLGRLVTADAWPTSLPGVAV